MKEGRKDDDERKIKERRSRKIKEGRMIKEERSRKDDEGRMLKEDDGRTKLRSACFVCAIQWSPRMHV